MQTKFILHGGFTPKTVQEDDAFFKEILKDAPQNPKILLVYFAKEEDRVAKNREEDIAQFEKNRGNKTISFETANEKEFSDQIARSDVIYLHGGRSVKILETLSKFKNLGQLFKGKTIAGDSAGANVLSVCFYSRASDGIFEGLGILPIKLIPHYSEDQNEKLQELKKRHSDMETVILSEYQTRIFYL